VKALLASCASSPESRAASARPCREGTTWLERILAASSTARPAEDLDLLLDVCDNISPASRGRRGRRRSARSARRRCRRSLGAARFRDEFEHYIEHGRPMDGIERHEPLHVLTRRRPPPKTTVSITGRRPPPRGPAPASG
jgi:NADH-quinone oxidoreductase subunit F